MKQFIIEKDFWDLFPGSAVGVVVANNIPGEEQYSDEQREAAAQILEKSFETTEQYIESHEISKNSVVAVWRDAYQKFPKKKGARCSFENLFKRVMKGNPVSSINPTVDISNAISLSYAFPIGAENLDAFVGDFRLGRAQGGEDFEPIGEGKQDPPLEGEICYMDDAGAVCRCLNWRDGVRTAVMGDCPHQFFAIECVDPERVDVLKKAVEDLAALLKEHVGAEIYVAEVLTAENPSVQIQ